MAFHEHPLERRARILAEKLKQTVRTTSDEINPPGNRPPLHNQLSAKAALAWWTEHRYDKLGQDWLQKVGATPAQVAQLDAWLYHATQAANPEAQAGAGMSLPQGDLPDPNSLIHTAMGAERRMEGPEVGSEVA